MFRVMIKITVVIMLIFLVTSMGVEAGEVQYYEVNCEKSNGENGFYLEIPQFQIKRMEQNVTIKYRLCAGDACIKEGTVENEELLEVKEGVYTLYVWAEKEDKIIKGSESKQTLKVDYQAPKEIEFIYEKDNEESICFSEETVVELKAADQTSGIDGIYYQVGDGEIQFMKGNHVFVFIPLEFQGKVKAYAVDRAGNMGSVSESKEIICEGHFPEITWSATEKLDAWHKQDILVTVLVKEEGIASGLKNVKWYINEKLLREKEYERGVFQEEILVESKQNCEIKVVAEDHAGNFVERTQKILYDDQKPQIVVEGLEDYLISAKELKFIYRISDDKKIENIRGEILCQDEKIPMTEWKRDGDAYVYEGILKKDGNYQVYVEVEDGAGNCEISKIRCTVDQTNPVIHQVEEWNGKIFQSFSWNYKAEDIITDMTSYTYHLKLDGRKFYENEKCTTEGSHIFEIEVEDVAGNRSSAKAEIMIDRTKPQIILSGVEAGKRYEEKVTLKVALEEGSSSTVKINGEVHGVNTHYVFEEAGKYKIEISSKDIAGNESKKDITFEVVEKTTLLEKLVDRTEQEEEEPPVVNEKENPSGMKWILITSSCIILLILMLYCFVKKKK